MKLDALIIQKEHLDKILNGNKTWEIRGSHCHKRCKIGLIESKSGTVVGTAELVDSIGPLTVGEFNKNAKKICAKPVKSKSDLYYERNYAWILKNAKRLKKPIKYNHKQGAVIWHPVDI